MSTPQWANPIGDVRVAISDGPTDKLAWDKKVVGPQNGKNRRFKTFEIRRVTKFVDCEDNDSTGVFLNYDRVTIENEDTESGMFEFGAGEAVPNDGDSLRATYYYQWFDDSEISVFLRATANFIGVGDDFTQITSDFQPAAIEFAAGGAYQKLASKFATNYHEMFQLYDAPDEKRFNPVTAFMNIAEKKFKLAFELRDDVYSGRKGKAGAPLTGVVRGRVRDTAPNR